MKRLLLILALPLAALALAGCSKTMDKMLQRSSSVVAEYNNTGIHAGADLTGNVSVGASRKSFRFAAIPNSTVAGDGGANTVLAANRGDDRDTISVIIWDGEGASASINADSNAAGVISLESGWAFGAPAASIGLADCIRASDNNADIARICRTPSVDPEPG